MLGIVALDTSMMGCCIAVPLPEVRTPTRREVRTLLKVAAHITAGMRLRGSLAGRPLPEQAEAILRPDGTVEHAEEPAKAPQARAGLRRLAVQVDRARSSVRREDPDRALELWTALVSGRWTLLDHFDSDGRRYIVARRNDREWTGPPS